jgi:hypothetical protein
MEEFLGSGSGDGLGNGTGNNDSSHPFELFWPCRHDYSELSRSTASPFVWNLAPQVQDARPYVAAVEAMFFVVGLVWNIFVLLSYCLKPRLLKEPANIYLFNLALVDLLLSILVTMSCFTFEVAGEFIFGSSDFVRCHICDFLGVALHTFISLSLHTLAMLSVDRFAIFYRPLRYKRIFDWKKALFIQAGLWILSIAISIPPIFGFGKYEFNIVFAACNARWTGQGSLGVDNIHYVTFFGSEALIPILVLSVTNVWVIKIVQKFLKRQITRKRAFRSNNETGEAEEKKYKRQQNQLVKVFGALFVAHILCWTPVLTTTFVALGIGVTRIPIQIFLASWLAYLTIPVVHPILESFFIKDLRYRVSKARKDVQDSLRKVHGSLISQVSTSSLMQSLSRTLSRESQSSYSSDHRKGDSHGSSSNSGSDKLDSIPEIGVLLTTNGNQGLPEIYVPKPPLSVQVSLNGLLPADDVFLPPAVDIEAASSSGDTTNQQDIA